MATPSTGPWRVTLSADSQSLSLRRRGCAWAAVARCRSNSVGRLAFFNGKRQAFQSDPYTAQHQTHIFSLSGHREEVEGSLSVFSVRLAAPSNESFGLCSTDLDVLKGQPFKPSGLAVLNVDDAATGHLCARSKVQARETFPLPGGENAEESGRREVHLS